MKKIIKSISVFLCLVIICTMAPISALAQINAPANLRYSKDEWGDGSIIWDDVPNSDYYNVYVSTDGVNFTIADTGCYYNEYYIPYGQAKGIYYYYVTAAVNEYYDGWYDGENYQSCYYPAEESAPSNVVTVYVYDSITPYCYTDYEVNGNGTLNVCWSVYSDNINRIDGFTVYQSKNGGEFVPAAQVAVSSYTNASDRYSYTCSLNISNTPASYKFVVASYAVLGGITYSDPDFTEYSEYTVYMPDPTLTTKTKSEVIKWKKVSGADSYVIYGGTYSKMKKLATVSGNKTSYTVKNVNNYKKDYVYYVACVSGGVEFSRTSYMSSSDGEARFRAAAVSKKKKNTVTVLNTRNSKSSTAWKVTISKKDRTILNKFAKKYFKKGWTNAQKAQFTLEWINKNVKYAYGSKYNKIAKCSYVEAIFSKKCGQCLQYNGAYAMFLTYLGYEARIIQGWRGSSMKNKWSHYWCEIKIDGKWYLMETGNYQDSGSWMYFCQPYRNASGYLINKKSAK